MPYQAKKPCKWPGCGVLTHTKYCDRHKGKAKPRTRPSAAKRGYDRRWRKESQAYLDENPWCVECEKTAPPHMPAVLVDHIIPHRGNMKLFWNRSNWQSMCERCHNRKTARGE